MDVLLLDDLSSTEAANWDWSRSAAPMQWEHFNPIEPNGAVSYIFSSVNTAEFETHISVYPWSLEPVLPLVVLSCVGEADYASNMVCCHEWKAGSHSLYVHFAHIPRMKIGHMWI